jgi:hypothetical protein
MLGAIGRLAARGHFSILVFWNPFPPVGGGAIYQ